MSNIDTQAVDDGSVESIVNDFNEMALGWYAAVTGKGIARGPGFTIGLAPGTTLPQLADAAATIDASAAAPVTAQLVSQPMLVVALAVVVVVALVMLR